MNQLKLYASDYFINSNFPLLVLKRDPELNYPLHTHDFYELVIIESGTGIHCTATQEYELKPGNIFVICPGVAHGYTHVENLVLYNVLFSSQILNGLSGDLKKMPGYQALFHVEPTYQASTTKSQKIIMLPPTQLPAIISIVDTIMEECRNDAVDKGSWTMAFSKLLQLLVTIFRICASTPVRTTDQSTIMRLAKVFSYIESNLGHPVPNEELSSVAAMSIATLNRYFKKTTGYSPVQYHIRKRIEYSCKLLLNTDLNIMEIAEKAGFSDSNYFARTFRKVMGASPSAFKKTNRLS